MTSQDLFIYFEHVKAIRERVYTNIHWVSGVSKLGLHKWEARAQPIELYHWLSEDSII